MLSSFLIFRIKEQLFSIDVNRVANIIQIPKVFQVPQSPDYVMGVFNLSGEVIPLINTGTKIGMGEVAAQDLSTVIILQRENSQGKFQKLGFLVDDVTDVEEIDTSSMQALPTSKYEFDQRFVDGMFHLNDEFAMLVNVENFFTVNLEELINTVEV